jgi:uncharacterized protein (DUF305 family)
MTKFHWKEGAMTAVLMSIFACSSVSAHDAASHSHNTAAGAEEAPFLTENDAAMAKMMRAMTVEPTGDVNRDFAEMMIPHHQGAIDMAQAYLRYGSNEQLKRMAQEIIVEQLQEIAAMRMALGDPLPASTTVPTQVAPISCRKP